MKDDQKHLRSLAIGAFYRFGWDGEGVQIPITRLLAKADNQKLEAIYKGLLNYRPFWRYINDENILNE